MRLFPAIVLFITILFTVRLELHAAEGVATGAPVPETARIATELEKIVPELMKRHNIPGISIALIRNAEIAWVKGFGVRVNGEPEKVDADTVFEAASFSKPVAAFGAMLLALNHVLDIDDPVYARLPEGYFGNQVYGNSITLRHLLSHTSGLSNNLIWKDSTIHFVPGSRFSYSGVGYNTMQKHVESVTEKSFNDYMTGAVFRKLGMASSGYVYRDSFAGNFASGHSSDTILPSLLVALALIIYGIVGIILFHVLHIKRWIEWEMGRCILRVIVSSAVYLACFFFIPASWPMALFSGVIGFSFFILLAILIQMIRGKFENFPGKVILPGVLLVVLAAMLAIIPSRYSFPSRERKFTEAHAASSLYTTPRDMALFLIEIMEPRTMGKEILSTMLSPQVRVNAHNSWGLGFGIQHSSRGETIWHWGHMPDYQHLFVADMKTKNGIVIMTNSTNGLDAVKDIARTALAGEHHGYWQGIPFIFLSW